MHGTHFREGIDMPSMPVLSWISGRAHGARVNRRSLHQSQGGGVSFTSRVRPFVFKPNGAQTCTASPGATAAENVQQKCIFPRTAQPSSTGAAHDPHTRQGIASMALEVRECQKCSRYQQVCTRGNRAALNKTPHKLHLAMRRHRSRRCSRCTVRAAPFASLSLEPCLLLKP